MPDCATCGGYVSPDFVRVFGDNDRIVRSCPSCRGTAPEPASAETVEEPAEYAATSSVSADGGERIEDDETTEEVEIETAPSLTADAAADDSANDPVDDGQGTSTGVGVGDAAEPETAVAADGGRSPLGFLRSVFSR